MQKIILGTFLLASASVQAQDFELSDRFQRFRLYTACAPLYLLVEGLSPDAADIGLTKQAITTTVRSRLRGARIYTSEEGTPYLYVNVNVVGRGYSYQFRLNKFVSDLETELIYPTATWNDGGAGTHGGDSGYILQAVGHLTDIFIDEYLAVNESACK